jgi:hypothetical protein
MRVSEREVRELIQSLVAGDIDHEEFLLEIGTDYLDTDSFEEASILTRDEGFIFPLGKRRVYVTIQVQ